MNPGNPIQNGFSFNGWFVNAIGGSAITFPFNHQQTSNFTLYAQWTPASTPTIDPISINSSLSTIYGNESQSVSFAVSGSNLSENITVTAQTGYQVSIDNINFLSSVNVTLGTMVYLRFLQHYLQVIITMSQQLFYLV